MTDLLIRGIDPSLKRWIEENARKNSHSMSEEAKAVLAKARAGERTNRKLGTEMANLVPEQFRGDDLVFEADEPIRQPPDLS